MAAARAQFVLVRFSYVFSFSFFLNRVATERVIPLSLEKSFAVVEVVALLFINLQTVFAFSVPR